jgi:hypothetical protein
VRRYLGRTALGLGIAGWLLLLGGLYAGGIDPSPQQSNALKSVIGFGLVAECLAVPTGLVALVIGPNRFAALAGLMMSAAYFLYFTGMVFMFLTA